MKDVFRKVAGKVSQAAGSPLTFLGAASIVAIWAFSRSLFPEGQEGFNTWQLVINTATTIVTFLMVFLIQNTQNRDGKAMQLKLDELIRSSTAARDSFVDLEDLSDDELTVLDDEFKALHDKQISSDAMKKLHQKIIHLHHKRKSFRGQLGDATVGVIRGVLDIPNGSNNNRRNQ